MAGPIDIEWIAVDWGTSNLRAWAMSGRQALAARSAPVGMAALSREQFEPALIATLGDWLADGVARPVIACGMVGARQGWVEMPYVSVPSTPLDPAQFRPVRSVDPRIAVTIVHGMSQADPPDVMRGEETQLAGLLALEPAFDGVACLLGTHSKWATLADGHVRGFRTFMTGEIYALLSRHSTLRHSIDETAHADPAAFDAGVAQAAGDPAALAAHLFTIRAAGLLGQTSAGPSTARLSGLLIGSEVGAMRTATDHASVTIIGDGMLADSYARAIVSLGGRCRMVEAERCTLAGLSSAYASVMRS